MAGLGLPYIYFVSETFRSYRVINVKIGCRVYMGKVRDIIDKTFEYGQGRGELPGVDELAEAIRVLSDSENPQSSQDDLTDFEYLKE